MSDQDGISKSLSRLIGEATRAALLDTYVCRPARVEKYDAATQKADVVTLIKRRYKQGDTAKITELPVIPSVPVSWPSADNGSSFIHLPLKAGDYGYVIFADRSLDAWLSGSGASVDPKDTRAHNINDAIFIPGLRTFSCALQGVNAANMVFKYKDAKVDIAPDGKIDITNGQMTITLTSSGKVSLTGTEELLNLIDVLLDKLIAATVVTTMGASPFTAITQTELTTLKSRLATIKV